MESLLLLFASLLIFPSISYFTLSETCGTPWGGWWPTYLRRIVRPPLLALIILDMVLALEVLQFATFLVVAIVYPEVLSATGKLSCELRRCFEVLVSNKSMLEDVTLHMLLKVFYFRVRLLLHNIRRTV